MAARREDVTIRVWLDRRENKDDPDVLEGDWRDKDVVLRLDGIRVQSNDLAFQESHSKSEPDWDAGIYGVDTQGRTVDLLSVFKQACLHGLALKGVIVGRDEQRHGK